MRSITGVGTYLQTKILRWELVLPGLGLLVPLLVPGPQLITGSIVNGLLALYALRIGNKRVIAMSTFPSVAALTRSILFGPHTPFLLYLIPFIWVSNILYITGIATLHRFPAVVRILAAAAIKSGFLFTVSYVLVTVRLIPQQLFVPMGLFQFITACIGGMLAVLIQAGSRSYGRR